VRLHLCGVRGSTPAPGAAFARVGGHTSSVAIAHDGQPPSLVLDAGTGIRRVADLLDKAPFVGTVILGHLHLDHIQGLPFFAAGDRPDARVRVLAPEQGVPADELLSRLVSPPLFPIGLGGLLGQWQFTTYDSGTFETDGFTITARDIPHPGGRALGLRVTDGSSTFAYLSDHGPVAVGPGPDGQGERHAAALELARGVDLLVHDAQLTPEELTRLPHYGHSTPAYALDLAERAGARRLVLFHHDPGRTDSEVGELTRNLRSETVEIIVGCEPDIVQLP
jgi:phosphoribosyl 1,2-cyclic phosphodiesterase